MKIVFKIIKNQTFVKTKSNLKPLFISRAAKYLGVYCINSFFGLHIVAHICNNKRIKAVLGDMRP